MMCRVAHGFGSSRLDYFLEYPSAASLGASEELQKFENQWEQTYMSPLVSRAG